MVWTEGDSVALQSSLDGVAFSATQPVGIAAAGEQIGSAAGGSAANTVHISWTTGNADGVTNGPFYRRSANGGTSFAAVQDLRGGSGAPFGAPAIINGTVARIVWPHSLSGVALDSDVHLAGQPNCAISWAAPVSGNWHDATKWSPAVVPVAGSSACITVEGDPYTVTVAGNQSLGELTIGHATSEDRATVRVTGSLSIGTSLVNSGELTFGSGAQIASTSGSVINTKGGRLTTQVGAPASLNAAAVNYGDVDLGARLTIATAAGRTFTNFGSFTIRPGATTVFGGGFVFNQNDGVLTVEGTMEFSAEFSTAGDTFNFNGGSVEGVVIIQGHSRLNIGPGSVGKGTFQFERNVTFGISSGGHLSGNIAPLQTIRLVGTVGGSSQANIAAGLTNAGTIELTATATNAGGAVLAIQGGTVVNTDTILVQRAGDVGIGRIDGLLENRGTFEIQDDLTFGTNGRTTNLGTVIIGADAALVFGANYIFNQNGGVLRNLGRMEMSAEFSTAARTPPNVHGWNNSDVAVRFSAEDALSGVGGVATVAVTATSEGANHTVTQTFADLAGNVVTAVVDAIHIDKTPPVVAGARQTLPNRFGWNNGPVVVSFSASDALSGIDGPFTGEATLSDEGADQSASLSFTDQAGNRASATAEGIHIDLTPPTIAGAADRAPNAAGWYNANVAVSFGCADALSGVDGCGPTPQVISEEGKDLFRTGAVTDRAGNTAQATVGGINLDKSAPTVACSNSAPTLWPPNHKLVAVRTTVAVTESLSGALGFTLRQVTSNEPDNGLGDGDTGIDIQDFAVGTPDTSGLLRAERSGLGTGRIYSLVYDGMDLAGNTAMCSTQVIVPHSQAGGKK